MLYFLRLSFLTTLRLMSRALYRHRTEWAGQVPERPFHDIRLMVLLNHTSLFELLLSGGMPPKVIREVSKRGLLPGADTTMDRPIVGKFFKWMVPHWVSITRRRDSTWDKFLSLIGPDTLVMLFPEGRMRRRGGLDKHGRPLTVRGGIAEILEHINEGNLLIVYSEGLHHIHAPGDKVPKLFQEVRLRYEQLPVQEYKLMMGFGHPAFARNVMHDLERRRDKSCYWDELSFGRGAPRPLNLTYRAPEREKQS